MTTNCQHEVCNYKSRILTFLIQSKRSTLVVKSFDLRFYFLCILKKYLLHIKAAFIWSKYSKNCEIFWQFKTALFYVNICSNIIYWCDQRIITPVFSATWSFRNNYNMQSKWITCSFTVTSTTWSHHLSFCFRFRINKHIQKKRRRNQEEDCVCSTDPVWREHATVMCFSSASAHEQSSFIRSTEPVEIHKDRTSALCFSSLTRLSRVPVRCIQTSAPLMSLNRNTNKLKWKDLCQLSKDIFT